MIRIIHGFTARAKDRSVAQEIAQILSEVLDTPPPASILDLRGLGKDLWRGTDAAEHADRERSSWD